MDGARGGRRLSAIVGAALLLSALPLVAVGPAVGAADPVPPVADPTGEGNVCEDAPDEEPFTDVATSDPGYGEIVCLFQAKITAGRTATTFEPNGTVSRREMALFLVRLIDTADRNDSGQNIRPLPLYDGQTDYDDVDRESPAVQEAIGRLDQAQIARGFGDGTFRPQTLLQRRQMAKFLVRVLEYVTGDAIGAASGDYFDDDEGDSAEQQFNALAERGIFVGDGKGSVNPAAKLTRRQMAAILLRGLEVRFEAGDIRRLFTLADAQVLEVDPDEPAKQILAQDDDRNYVVRDLTSGQAYRITLVAASKVTIDSTGRARFATTTPTSGDCANVRIADPGPPAARLISVNGVAVSPSPDHTLGAIEPSGRSISFIVEGLVPETVIPVVYEDNDATGCTFLEVDANGVPTERFGIGGRTEFVVAPRIAEVKALEDASPSGVSAGDRHRFIFSEQMAETVDDNGSSYSLQGSNNPITCGNGTTCTLYLSPVTIGGTTHAARTVMEVTLGPGAAQLPPVSYPATITAVSNHWKNPAGTALDVLSSDEQIEVDTAAPATTPIPPRPISAVDTGNAPDTATITFSEPVDYIGPLWEFTVLADGGKCGDPSVANGNATAVKDDDLDEVLIIEFGGDIPAGSYELCVGDDSVEDLDGNPNVDQALPITFD